MNGLELGRGVAQYSGFWVCALALSLLVAGCEAFAREPVQMQSDDDRLILESFLKHAAANAGRVTPEAVAKITETEDICWTWSQYLRPPLVAYQLSADPKYLDLFVQAMDAMLTRLRPGPDGYLGFRGLPLGLFRNPDNPTAEVDVDIAEFEVTHIICDFAELLAQEPGLKGKYGEKLAHYLDIAQKHLAGPKWDSRKLYVDLGDQGAAFRMPAECGNNRDNLTNPHNKQSKMCRTYLALYRVTGNDDYFRRAVKLGTRLKRLLALEGDHYLWHYWDPAGDWDRKPDAPTQFKHWIGPEHRGGYHALTVQMATELYDHGVVFDRTDMERFVNTQTEVCWNASVDDPKFTTTGGKTITEAGHGIVMAPSLAPFDKRIWEYCYGPRATKERLAARQHGWQGGPNAVGYLVGKYLSAPSPEQTHAACREQFCRQPENAAFLKAIEFTIPGAAK